MVNAHVQKLDRVVTRRGIRQVGTLTLADRAHVPLQRLKDYIYLCSMDCSNSNFTWVSRNNIQAERIGGWLDNPIMSGWNPDTVQLLGVPQAALENAQFSPDKYHAI
ncbi:hypothetical protein EVAR_57810_1 [Eumeta japonica]|uniref:Uncharacterized protein n=1 Tax=Eumeta variegata TaxID=151549 RepID=A0A4C1Z4D4_EUMVA|nr:hypothetical protein EVAR_57810_1 [Eumeta japonica]